MSSSRHSRSSSTSELLLFFVAVLTTSATVVMLMWNWFIPNTIAGAPELNLGQAAGIILVFQAIRGTSEDYREQRNLTARFVLYALTQLFFLGIGYVVYVMTF